MNMRERIKRFSAENIAIRDDLKATLRKLIKEMPQNPAFHEIEGSPKAGYIMSSDLGPTLNLSPRYHDNRAAIQDLCNIIDKAVLVEAVIDKFDLIVKTGRLNDQAFNPTVQAYLKEILSREEEDFISLDKTTIRLPVPLGTTVWEFVTKCNDACTFQAEEFDAAFPPKEGEEGRCSMFLPCHTRFCWADTMTLTLNNLSFILERWQKSIFATKEEAQTAGEKLVEEHKKQLLEKGLKIQWPLPKEETENAEN